MDNYNFELILVLVLLAISLFFAARHFFAPRRVVINLDDEIETARLNLIKSGRNEADVNHMFIMLWPNRYKHLIQPEVIPGEEP
jgi:hypothetical protein